jgi:hypothetical protein
VKIRSNVGYFGFGTNRDTYAVQIGRTNGAGFCNARAISVKLVDLQRSLMFTTAPMSG